MVARKSVTIRGETFPSQMAAGRALGVAQASVSRHLAAGTLDLVGLPLTRCRVLGVVYPTMADAARALGCNWTTIKRAIEEGREASVLSGAHPRAQKPCRMNGRDFPSMTVAAQVLGVHRTTVSMAIKRGQTWCGNRPGRHQRGVAA